MSNHLCGDGIPFSLRCVVVSSVPLFFIIRCLGMTSVLARTSSRNYWLVRISKDIVLDLSLSNRCYWTLTWRWVDLQNSQVQCFDLADIFGTFGRFPMRNVLGKYSTRTQSVLHRFQIICCKNWTVEVLRVEHSIFGSLLNALASSPSTKRIWVDAYFCFRPLDYLIVFQYQCLLDIEQIIEHFEVGVPV